MAQSRNSCIQPKAVYEDSLHIFGLDWFEIAI